MSYDSKDLDGMLLQIEDIVVVSNYYWAKFSCSQQM